MSVTKVDKIHPVAEIQPAVYFVVNTAHLRRRRRREKSGRRQGDTPSTRPKMFASGTLAPV